MNLEAFINSRQVQAPHVVLFGNPIGHTLSPVMHNTAARYYELDIRYFAVQLEAYEIKLLDEYLQHPMLKAVNLTIPFKQDFIPYCQSLHEVSSTIQAVNTLVRKENGWKGYNTDVYGFTYPLRSYRDKLKDRNAIVFGSGGAARAVIYALQQLGMKQITVVSRNPAGADSRVKELAHAVIEYRQWPNHTENTALIVNTTPVGMEPHLGKSPVRDDLTTYLTDKICYDLVYNPAQTRFLEQAAEAGAMHTMNGLDMLIHQGSKLFELWTGKSFPISTIQQAIEDEFNIIH